MLCDVSLIFWVLFFLMYFYFLVGQEDTAQFLADHKVHVVASMPCYSAENVNRQRGAGVFGKSIQSLLNLNELGYGKPDSGLILDLVYNPQGQ